MTNSSILFTLEFVSIFGIVQDIGIFPFSKRALLKYSHESIRSNSNKPKMSYENRRC